MAKQAKNAGPKVGLSLEGHTLHGPSDGLGGMYATDENTGEIRHVSLAFQSGRAMGYSARADGKGPVLKALPDDHPAVTLRRGLLARQAAYERGELTVETQDPEARQDRQPQPEVHAPSAPKPTKKHGGR
jgi:hypothetical protein